jgi:hypothetical protein
MKTILAALIACLVIGRLSQQMFWRSAKPEASRRAFKTRDSLFSLT